MKSNNYKRNLLVIKTLKSEKANMKLQHTIEHHIYSYSKHDFESVSKMGNEYGYKILHQSFNKEYECWSQDLVKSSLPNIKEIEKQSKEIEHISAQCNSEYDGWGTEVEK